MSEYWGKLMTRPIEVHHGIPCYVVESTDEFCGDCFFIGHDCKDVPCASWKGRVGPDVEFEAVDIDPKLFNSDPEYTKSCEKESTDLSEVVDQYVLNQLRRGYPINTIVCELYHLVTDRVAVLRRAGAKL